MKLTNRTAGENLDGVTRAARRNAARFIDGLRVSIGRMANKVGKRFHWAGAKVTSAGTKIADAGAGVEGL